VPFSQALGEGVHADVVPYPGEMLRVADDAHRFGAKEPGRLL
jgi:hypothetical protein